MQGALNAILDQEVEFLQVITVVLSLVPLNFPFLLTNMLTYYFNIFLLVGTESSKKWFKTFQTIY